MDTVLAWIGKLPTTNARIGVTLLLSLGTAVRYWAGNWEPGYEWLAFLLVMSGLDVTQFHSKRTTDAAYVEANNKTEAK